MNWLLIVDILLVVASFGYGIFSIFAYRKALTQNEATAQRVLSTPESFVPLSEKSKKFINAEIINRGLDPEDFLLVTCMSNPGAAQDHLALLGSEHLIISIPSEDAIVLNIILEKDTVTESDQETLLKIKFFIGRNIVHAQRYFNNSFLSALNWGEFHKMLSVVFEVSLWLTMRYFFGITHIVALLVFVSIVDNWVGNITAYLYSSFSHKDADINASDDIQVLQAGARVIRNQVTRITEPRAMNAWNGFLWTFSENAAYIMGTGHFHPEKRVEYLQNKIKQLRK